VTQTIDVRYRDKVESSPLNTRFSDITGPCVLAGFRFVKGPSAFTVNLSRDGFLNSIAITPSGARVMESTDLISAITVTANPDAVNARKDGIYLLYIYGTNEAVATYVVVPGQQGTTTPNPNPNPLTYLLLGYINVPPNNVDLVFPECFAHIPYGFAKLDVSGPAHYHGPAVFDQPVIFNALVTFENGSTDGGSGGGGGTPTALVRLPYPMIATIGQTSFTLPSAYTPATNSLFVFVDWVLQSPDMYLEQNATTFVFYDALKGGEAVYAFWFKNLTVYEVAPHNHDDRYYTKTQEDAKAVRYFQDNMAGPTGRTLTHNLGTLNYVILGIVPTTRSLAVGDISVDKNINTIVVYNAGSYTGAFDLSYIVKT
jgi:hypothetical protein